MDDYVINVRCNVIILFSNALESSAFNSDSRHLQLWPLWNKSCAFAADACYVVIRLLFVFFGSCLYSLVDFVNLLVCEFIFRDNYHSDGKKKSRNDTYEP